VDKEQVILAVRRIEDLNKDMRCQAGRGDRCRRGSPSDPRRYADRTTCSSRPAWGSC
jgi:hypothetical protein